MLRLVFVLFLLSACARTVPVQTVTVNGYDAASGIVIDPINLWRDYADRSKGIAGQVHHGERVTFIRQEGQGAFIETANGVRGWLNAQFVRR